MASKRELIAVEALRHFKTAQLSAWVGDEEAAEEEFDKCGKAIGRFRALERQRDLVREGFDELGALDELRKVSPRKSDERISQVEKREVLELTRRVGKMTYTVIPQGSSRAEFRALIDVHPRRLRGAAPARDKENQADHRTWRWIEINTDAGFTGVFLLTFADGTLYAQVTAHEFFSGLEAISRLSERLAHSVADKLRVLLVRQ
jgi:hypothetical protein